MNSAYKITTNDMALLPSIFKFTTPAEIPLRFAVKIKTAWYVPRRFVIFG